MDRTDQLVIVLSILASVIVYAIQDDVFALSCIFLTHLFIIPSLILLSKTKTWWLLIFAVFSVIASLLWHFSREWFYEENLLKLDIIHQNLLIALSVALIVFKHVPRFMVGVLFTYTILLSLFGLEKVFEYDMYSFFTGIWVIVLIAHFVYVICKGKDVPYLYLSIMVFYTSVAVLLYETASGDTYHSIHSIWHILAYTSFYFSLKISFKEKEKTNMITSELPRRDFSKLKQLKF